MAGSYNHITNGLGKFTGTQTIDNLGDAHEALEECYGMIWYLAHHLDKSHHRSAHELDDVARLVEAAENNYKFGLEHSPGRTRYAKEQGAGIETGQWGEGR